MEDQTTKLGPIKKFFLICSGSDLLILSQPECHIELNKHIGIGATILSTALLASLSGGYALFTVFNPINVNGTQPSLAGYVLPICFGLLWGAIIFNLDRYIVSTIRKINVPPRLPFKELLRWRLSEFTRIAPRLILALFISIIITRPIELKVFGTEIEKEMLRQTTKESAEMAGKIDQEFPDIDRLTKENKSLQQQIDAKRTQVNGLYELALKEGMGERLDNTTGHKGKGPFYRERMTAYSRGVKELEELIQTNEAKIAANEASLAELRRQKAIVEQGRQPTIAKNGLLAQLNTLGYLSEQNPPIRLASWFLIFLFVILETAPIVVKTLSDRGPYDEIYETVQQSVSANEQKKSFEIETELAAHMTLTERLEAEGLAAKLQLSRRMMDSFESLAATEMLKAQTEIARLIVEQWKRAEENSLKVETAYRFQNGNSAPASSGPAATTKQT